MKKFLTAEIAPNVRAPFSKRSLEHLQEAYQECLDGIVKGLINDSTKLTVLSGCVLASNAPNYTLTAGFAYWQGELFQVDAAAVNVPGGQVLLWTIEETFRTGDPVLFTDNNPRNVHSIRKLKLTAGASGSGVANNDAIEYLYKPKWIDFPFTTGASGTLQYSKDPFGDVRFRGDVDTLPDGLVTVGTLPEGFRPTMNCSIPIIARNDGSLTSARAIFFTTGLVTLGIIGGSFTSFNNVDAGFTSISFNAN